MNKERAIAAGILVLAVVAAGWISWSAYRSETTSAGSLDGFVQCIKDKGIVFYGAFWCPHCQRTKQEFGDSAPRLPYVECSTPDGGHQTQVCIDKGIHEYPTWVLRDGTRVSGEHTLQELSDAFHCPLPGSGSASSTPLFSATSSPR